ncbi:hypothetical protein D3C72_2467340 [compost metagenome]
MCVLGNVRLMFAVHHTGLDFTDRQRVDSFAAARSTKGSTPLLVLSEQSALSRRMKPSPG